MTDDPLHAWEVLFQRALELIDSVEYAGVPASLVEIAPVLRARRATILDWIKAHDLSLRETCAALHMLDYSQTYDECVALVRKALG